MSPRAISSSISISSSKLKVMTEVGESSWAGSAGMGGVEERVGGSISQPPGAGLMWEGRAGWQGEE